jgi:hypothetical protein
MLGLIFFGKDTKSMVPVFGRVSSVIFFTVLFCQIPLFSSAQTFPSDTICGDWVIDPEPPEGDFKYFSFRKRGRGYELFLFNQPNSRFSGLANPEKEHWLMIVDGLLVKITWRKEDDHILVYKHDENEFVFEMKRVALPAETGE